VLKGVQSLVRWTFRLAGVLLAQVLGRWQWQSPAWLRLCFRGAQGAWGWIKGNPRRFAKYAGTLVVLAAIGGGAWYAYSLIPKPELVTLDVTNPPLTQLEDEHPKPQPLVVHFSASVAPLDLVGKEVVGVRTKPELAGRWSWRDDQTLVLEPEADWPVGQVVDVSFDRTLSAIPLHPERMADEAQRVCRTQRTSRHTRPALYLQGG
jgi:hypothetical protein